MEFHLAINLERENPHQDILEIAQNHLELVQLADQNGFSTLWSAEHHALEMTIAPNPFQILTWWASHTQNIRLGTAVAVAAYWHPINLAGEAAFTDLISNGRLEFGIGAGAYQREFDRMHYGLKQSDSWKYMHEMLPILKALWAGDYEHDSEYWKFPVSTSVPKPIQKPHPPIWVAARSPITFEWAVKNECNILSWPLTRAFSEVELYREQLEAALTKYPNLKRPIFALMRHTFVYENESDWMVPVEAIQNTLRKFENLFQNLGGVENGFPEKIALDKLKNKDQYNPEMLSKNLIFGTPSQVIEKLKLYEKLGVDAFIYYANAGISEQQKKHSLELFCKKVIPAFR